MPQAIIPIATTVAGSLASAGASKLFAGKDKTGKFQQKIGQGSIDLAKQLAALAPQLDPKAVAKPYDDAWRRLQAMQSPLTKVEGPSGKFTINNRTGGVTSALSPQVQGLLQGLGGARNQAVTGLTGNISGLNDNLAGYKGLIAGLNPGFGQVTDARVNAIRNQGLKAQSDLAHGLAQRRVAGSSFANAAESQRAAEFAQQEADTRAKSYLEELDANRMLRDDINKTIAQKTDTLNKRYEVHQNAVTTELNQRNFATDLAAKLQAMARQSLDQSRQLMADLMRAGATAQLQARTNNQDAVMKALIAGLSGGIDAGQVGASQQRDVGQAAGFLGGKIGDAVQSGLSKWANSPSNTGSWNTTTTFA